MVFEDLNNRTDAVPRVSALCHLPCAGKSKSVFSADGGYVLII
jgi:hypothetical protein